MESAYSFVLERLKEGPDADVLHITYEEVFTWAMERLLRRQMCNCRLLEIAQVAVDSIFAQYTGNNIKWIIEKQTEVGVLIMEVVIRQVGHSALSITGHLERLVSMAVSLVAPWRPGLYTPEGDRTILSIMVRKSLAWALRSSSFCPNDTLRAELLRFVSMCEVEDIMDADLSHHATCGLLLNVLNLTVTHLLPKGRIGLLWPIRKIIHHFYGAMGVLLRKCRENIEQLVIGEKERGATHLVTLMGQAARRVLWLRRTGNLSPVATVEEFLNILHILRLVVAWPPEMNLFHEPGMCRIAARAIATTCNCVLQTLDASVPEVDFVRLLDAVNNLFMTLAHFPPHAAVLELRCYHGHCLSRVVASLEKFKLHPICVPDPQETMKPDAPARFLDVLTGRLMEEPVKLLDTGVVMDQATLLTTLLATPVDPKTGDLVRDMSYELMPDLQEEIEVWRQQQQQMQEKEQQQPSEDE